MRGGLLPFPQHLDVMSCQAIESSKFRIGNAVLDDSCVSEMIDFDEFCLMISGEFQPDECRAEHRVWKAEGEPQKRDGDHQTSDREPGAIRGMGIRAFDGLQLPDLDPVADHDIGRAAGLGGGRQQLTGQTS